MPNSLAEIVGANSGSPSDRTCCWRLVISEILLPHLVSGDRGGSAVSKDAADKAGAVRVVVVAKGLEGANAEVVATRVAKAKKRTMVLNCCLEESWRCCVQRCGTQGCCGIEKRRFVEVLAAKKSVHPVNQQRFNMSPLLCSPSDPDPTTDRWTLGGCWSDLVHR